MKKNIKTIEQREIDYYKSAINRLQSANSPAKEKADLLSGLLYRIDGVLESHINPLQGSRYYILPAVTLVFLAIGAGLTYVVRQAARPEKLRYYDNFDSQDYEKARLQHQKAALGAGILITSLLIIGFVVGWLQNIHDESKSDKDNIDKYFTSRSSISPDVIDFIQKISGIQPSKTFHDTNLTIYAKKQILLDIFHFNKRSKEIVDTYLSAKKALDTNETKIKQLEKKIESNIKNLTDSAAAAPLHNQTEKPGSAIKSGTVSATVPITRFLCQQESRYLNEILERYNTQTTLETYLQEDQSSDGLLTERQIHIIELKIELLNLQEQQPKLIQKQNDRTAHLTSLFTQISTNNVQYDTGKETLVSNNANISANHYGTFSIEMTSRQQKRNGENQSLLGLNP